MLFAVAELLVESPFGVLKATITGHLRLIEIWKARSGLTIRVN